MALKIAGRLFTGPYSLDESRVRKNQPAAVYAIISRSGEPWNPTFRLIDVDETGEQDVHFRTHRKRPEWERHDDGELSIYFFYMSVRAGHTADERRRLVDAIKIQYDPPNGMISLAAGS
jgi:hypothetical protein